jgi:DNA-binding transcriptional regulator YhcF (GntR family)
MTWRRSEEIAKQLRQHVVTGLHFGLLKHGARLPSARALAHRYGVHQRVVIAAYHALELEGVVELRSRSGAYVATPSGPEKPQARLARWMADLFADGLARGIAVPELSEQLRRHAGTLQLRAACVECNVDQLHSLCDELRRDYGFETSPVELESVESGAAEPSLRGADLVLTTALHEHVVRRAADSVGRPCIAISLRLDIAREIGRLLRKGPVYVVATDPRFGPKLREILAPVTDGRTVETLIVGRDEIRVPNGVPVYVMKSARAALAASPLLRRTQPMDRVFSTESAREIIDYIVRENSRAMASRA